MASESIKSYEVNRERFDRYQTLLLKWNQKMNLTAITLPHEVMEKHFLDSLALLDVSRETFFPDVSRETISVLDVGSGGGFPGIPLKIALPSLDITLVDSLKKRCDFLKEVIRALSLTGIQVLHQKLVGQSVGEFNVVVSRATFSLSEFLMLGSSSVKPQGTMLALKSTHIEDEIHEAKLLAEGLHFSSFQTVPYQLPFSKAERQVVIMKR